VTLIRLDARVTDQEPDLLEVSAGSPAALRAGTAKVVCAEGLDADRLRRLGDDSSQA